MPRKYWLCIAIRTKEHKNIWDNQRPYQPELHDLKSDPAEQINIYSDHPQVVNQLQF